MRDVLATEAAGMRGGRISRCVAETGDTTIMKLNIACTLTYRTLAYLLLILASQSQSQRQISQILGIARAVHLSVKYELRGGITEGVG